MPLPADQTPWPPKALLPLLDRVKVYDAWYGGERDTLATVLGRQVERERPSAMRWAKFWQRDVPVGQRDDRLHVPLPSDMATMSADLLFTELPALTLDDKTGQDRLTELVELVELQNRLSEAGEVCAALGGVYIKADWSADVADHPLLAVVHNDQAVPEFAWGRLVAVTFFRELARDTAKVLRHLERHSLDGETGSRAVIEHALYEGTDDNLGQTVPLTEHPETAALAGSLTDGNRVVPGIDLLTAAYVPNMLPNRGNLRNTPHGRSDFHALEPIFDALDEVYTSWMRDVRLAKARLVVPSGYLDSAGRGKGSTFDIDRELYEGLEMPPPGMATGGSSASGITLVQFAIRFEEHERTAEALVRKAIGSGGYSPQTFGLVDDGGAVTATEVNAKERRSMTTRGRKIGYWRPAVRHMAHVLLALDAALFGSGVTPAAPLVEWGDGVSEDPHETAETLELLERAKAVSIETKVQMLHPDWDDTAVSEEVERITKDQGMGELLDPTKVGSVPPGSRAAGERDASGSAARDA